MSHSVGTAEVASQTSEQAIDAFSRLMSGRRLIENPIFSN